MLVLSNLAYLTMGCVKFVLTTSVVEIQENKDSCKTMYKAVRASHSFPN